MKQRADRARKPAERRSSLFESALLFLCLAVLALRGTYTEGPAVQTLTLPGGLTDALYSLMLSGVLGLALLLWFVRQVWQGRVTYRVTGLEVGLILFLIAAVVSAFGASDKRLAINHVVMLSGPLLSALLLVQILTRNSRIWVVFLVIGALGVVSAYQCAEQFLVSNKILIEQYAREPELLLRPLGIEPGSFQHFLFEHRLYGRGIRGFFTTSNSAASFSILAFFAAVALLLGRSTPSVDEKPRPRSRWFPMAAAGIILAGLLLTQSKGGILAFFAAAVALVILLLAHRRIAAHRRAVWIVSTVAILLVSLAAGYGIVSYGLRHGRLPGGNSMLVRWQYWRASVEMYADHAVTGVGPGNFGQYYTHYKPGSAPESVSDPHSFPLSLLTQYGPLGLLGFLLLVGIPIYRHSLAAADSSALPDDGESGRRVVFGILLSLCATLLLIRPILIPTTGQGDMGLMLYEIVALYVAPVAAFLIGFLLVGAPLKGNPVGPDGAGLRMGGPALGCAIAGVLLHNLIDFALFEPGIWTTLWTVMACLIAIGHARRPLRPVTLHAGKTFKTVGLLSAVVLVVAYVAFIWAPVYDVTAGIQRSRQAIATGQYSRAHLALDTASAADPLSPEAPGMHGRLYLQQAQEAPIATAAHLEEAMQRFQVAISRDPADYKNYERAGDVATLAGRYSEAYEWYEKAGRRYPGSGRLQLRLAQTAEQLGQPTAALGHYRRTVEIEDAFRRQFEEMYPTRENVVSRLGQDNYDLARRRIAELSR